ncbi:MAG: hypothetical protein KatS3mg015_3233 [Fimbriimonadales bacterium]|nr:MAG: hypothetical protein KatS3mg015_3233 [Fimbriimonadales bacterium]
MKNSHFEFSEFLKQATGIRNRLCKSLDKSPDEKVRELLDRVPAFKTPETPDASSAPLTVAFVGQYDSGKSTIISALTNRRDIPIDADVCTDKVTAYDWNGIRILDTPGIHAGYPDHDEITYAAIDKADLLVFVITNELFDDVIGAHFRDLCFNRNKASETLLVVNKMGQDSGTPEIKLPDIERVTRPLRPQDFRTTFIDALSYLEAGEESDEDDRRELLEIANFDSFVEALNRFVRDKGMMGRLTTPLFEFRAIAQQAEAFLSVDLPEERAAIELLHRKRVLLLGSRSRLRGTMSGLVSAAASDLVALGDAVAESVEPGSTEESVQAEHEAAQKKARERCERLASDAQTAVEVELVELRRQLEALENGVLAQELKGKVSPALIAAKKEDLASAHPSVVQLEVGCTTPSDWPKRVKKVAEVANALGEFAARWATGPMAEGAEIGSAIAARGSQAHKVVYNVGKFFGVKFRPWGAVKVARAIGNAGRIIAAVGGVLAVVAQIAEEKQLDEYRLQLREARDGIRAAYRESVLEIERAFWVRFEEFNKDFYESELEAVDDTLADLVGQRSGRKEAANDFSFIASECTQLIQKIQDSEVGNNDDIDGNGTQKKG